MDVRIGVTYSPKELDLELADDADAAALRCLSSTFALAFRAALALVGVGRPVKNASAPEIKDGPLEDLFIRERLRYSLPCVGNVNGSSTFYRPVYCAAQIGRLESVTGRAPY